MILCIVVTAGFRNQNQIGNAYGSYCKVIPNPVKTNL
ncbi:hypothetical protein BVRB_6g141810 [Beta vulgaris subsp. vulgaris]|nr:hypothetical protein BVRB_6g141810 [Beta vulgaris subsp. vulgaris]